MRAILTEKLRDWMARPHAAIGRRDSYRMDVNGSNHYSFTNICDGYQVMFNLGVISSDELTYMQNSWPCASTGWSPATIPAAQAHQVVTKYMIAFLETHLRQTHADKSILTPGYAVSHKPRVQFFASEHCIAPMPDASSFTYRPHQLRHECVAAEKDPAGWFTQ
jgi:hypothetical protein